MHPRTRSVLVVAVVAVVAAAPAAGIAASAAAPGSATTADAVDRPVLDDLNGSEDDESSDWPLLGFDDHEEDDEDDEDDEDRDEEDKDDEDDRDDEDEEGDEQDDEDEEDEADDEDEDDREDDDTDGDRRDEAEGGDEQLSSDDPEADSQQSSGSSDDGQSNAEQTDSDQDQAGDTSESQSVRVQEQESDEGQEGDGGRNATENATRNDTVEPGPDVGSANVTVLRTPEVVGQPLVVTATTTNEGTEAGRKVVQFEVEHVVLENRSFVLQPNETKTVTFTHVFETPGNKTFEVDSGVNRFVTVEERRPNLSVSTVDAEPESVEAGEDVTITAVVRNDGYANGSLPVALELFGEVVAVKDVTLATGESAEVTFTRTVHAPGTYEATVENESAEFRVTGDAADGTTETTTDPVLESAAETSGFAPLAAVAGVVVAVALVLARRT